MISTIASKAVGKDNGKGKRKGTSKGRPANGMEPSNRMAFVDIFTSRSSKASSGKGMTNGENRDMRRHHLTQQLLGERQVRHEAVKGKSKYHRTHDSWGVPTMPRPIFAPHQIYVSSLHGYWTGDR